MTKFLKKQLQTGNIHFDSRFQRRPSIRLRRLCQGKAVYITAAREQRKRIQEELRTDRAPMIHPNVSQLARISCLSHLLIMLLCGASIRSFIEPEC